ncbi:MAG: asparagine synthase C-terminal domain-containing protein, partial [Brevefilum sp.]|nr:asparagine synthase C-terminal domain-containing protein [Brevefilum sp.]
AIFRTAQEKGIRNLLTGGQGNLTISWTGNGLLTELIQQGHLTRALSEARALTTSDQKKSALRMLLNKGLMPLLPTPLWLATRSILHKDAALRKAYHAKTPWQDYAPIHPDFARKHRVFDRALENGHDFFYRQCVDTRKRRLKIIENSGKLFDGIMMGYQKIYHVATRDPSTDQRLVEFCLKLPEEQFLRSGISKWLIRRAMADKLPSEVLWNKERGLQAADWYIRLLKAKPKIQETLHRLEKSDLVRQAIDLNRLRRLVDAMPKTGIDPQGLIRDYRQVLETGLMTGSFMLWFETGHWR